MGCVPPGRDPPGQRLPLWTESQTGVKILPFVELLDTFRMKQTQMNVCTLEEFILVEIWYIAAQSWSDCIGKYTGLYTHATMEGKCENCSWMTIDSGELRELQWHEKVSVELTNVWSVIPLFASRLTPVCVNGIYHWLFSHQTAGKTIECHSCN